MPIQVLPAEKDHVTHYHIAIEWYLEEDLLVKALSEMWVLKEKHHAYA